jgi:hypothetical protein
VQIINRGEAEHTERLDPSYRAIQAKSVANRVLQPMLSAENFSISSSVCPVQQLLRGLDAVWGSLFLPTIPETLPVHFGAIGVKARCTYNPCSIRTARERDRFDFGEYGGKGFGPM